MSDHEIAERRQMTVPDLQAMAKAMGPLFKKKPEDMFALMLIAQAEGLHPAIAAQEYDIIDGRPAINSRSALARFQKAGGTVSYVQRTDDVCIVDLSHPVGGKLQIKWTMDMARAANLAHKDNWKKYPRAMLAARCVAEGVRALYPACLSGLYTVEEVQDFDGGFGSGNQAPGISGDPDLRKQVIDYIASVAPQISDTDLTDVKRELKEAKNDPGKLNAIKDRIDRLIDKEPVITGGMTEAEDAEASRVFDEAQDAQLEIF